MAKSLSYISSSARKQPIIDPTAELHREIKQLKKEMESLKRSNFVSSQKTSELSEKIEPSNVVII